MAPAACKICQKCNVLQVPIQIIPPGVPKRGRHLLRSDSEWWCYISESSFRTASPTLNSTNLTQPERAIIVWVRRTFTWSFFKNKILAHDQIDSPQLLSLFYAIIFRNFHDLSKKESDSFNDNDIVHLSGKITNLSKVLCQESTN